MTGPVDGGIHERGTWQTSCRRADADASGSERAAWAGMVARDAGFRCKASLSPPALLNAELLQQQPENQLSAVTTISVSRDRTACHLAGGVLQGVEHELRTISMLSRRARSRGDRQESR